MKLVPPETSTCATCGAPSEETLNGDVGCMVCLLRVGLEEAADQMEEPDSDQFGPYSIERRKDGSVHELGRGAMGVTYRATDTSLKRAVALKIIKIDPAGRNTEARERFMREARAAAALRHPNVATAYHFGIREETGQCFYAMELVEGETLDARVRRTGPLDVRATVEIARQIAGAIGAAEKRGLVHRDLKPANIMIATTEGADGVEKSSNIHIKVIDFGVAKALTEEADPRVLTHSGFVGTPAFASPEQFVNAPVDVRSDIYSLGATLWYLLTGKIPFANRAEQNAPPLAQLSAASVPSALSSLLVRMLAVEPAARPSVRDLQTSLAQIHARISDRGKRSRWFAAAAVVLTIGAFLVFRWRHETPNANIEPGFKSIAVLPFDNLTNDNAKAQFASGIQDDLLVNLSKIADLKVIARDSVLPYKGAAQDVRGIGKILRVAAVLKGNVRYAGTHARINVQLIDTKNGEQIWAENYDREIDDVLSVQSELALRIAAALHAKLSPVEKASITTPPTRDLEAYNLYLRARELIFNLGASRDQEADTAKTIELLNQAVALDPGFALAYSLLSRVHVDLFYVGRGTAHLEQARSAIEAALRLAPDSGETHFANAFYLFHGLGDPERALPEFAMAKRELPNNADVFAWSGILERRLGLWARALHDLQRAAELDPHNALPPIDLIVTYEMLRNYAEAERVIERALIAIPSLTNRFRARKADLALTKGDTRACRTILESLPPDYKQDGFIPYVWARLALYNRDYTEGARILGEIPPADLTGFAEAWVARDQAFLARAQGDAVKAKSALLRALEVWQARVNPGTNEFEARSYVALWHAALGHKEDAISESEKAVNLNPLSRDATNAPALLNRQALVYVWCGEHDRALKQLEALTKIPGGASPGDLKLNAAWDDLRDEPRFHQIVAAVSEPFKFE